MLDTLSALPLSFWMTVALLLGGAGLAIGKVRRGIGLPMLAVLITIAVWYVADLFYNDYQDYRQNFNATILENAWWQVALFVLSFLLITPLLHEGFNTRYLRKTSFVYRIVKTGKTDSVLQQGLNTIARSCVVVFLLLAFIAVIRLKNEIPYYFFPFLSHKADPFARGRLGSGGDWLLSIAGYLHLFISASFGVVAALARNRRVRAVAIVGCALCWPYYIFDRTRNTMLTAILPCILAWTTVRLRGGWPKKVLVLASFFLVISTWFAFVLANRSTSTITDALGHEFRVNSTVSQHHLGLNMYEELCWINSLVDNGFYDPKWGARYIAELLNPVPRTLWPGKPMVGIDYAMARGQAYGTGDAGVGASISTGMVGQGVVNFGRFFGPIFAALLMSIWAAMLARLDLRGGELILYGLGLTLTFNLGRDITFITLYTFVFGAVLFALLNRTGRRVRLFGKKSGRLRRMSAQSPATVRCR